MNVLLAKILDAIGLYKEKKTIYYTKLVTIEDLKTKELLEMFDDTAEHIPFTFNTLYSSVYFNEKRTSAKNIYTTSSTVIGNKSFCMYKGEDYIVTISEFEDDITKEAKHFNRDNRHIVILSGGKRWSYIGYDMVSILNEKELVA